MPVSLSRLILGPLALLVLVVGCAKEQPAIDRVQPDYFDKEFFVGKDYLNASDDPEFFSQGTLVDVGYGAGQDGLFTSTYAQPMTRVRWTIQEGLLVARLAYERVENSDGKGTSRGTGKMTNNGTVVAAYPILKHFDVKRSYNAGTGEQLNVVEENSVDRPWSQRQFIRVDWSKNLSIDNYDYDMLSMLGIYGGVTYEPLSYYVNDPSQEDAPHFDKESGYLDITNKAFAHPQMLSLPTKFGGGTIPACMIGADFKGGGSPTTACAPIELTIRHSFRQVKDTDYEPADWDGYRFQAFGAFTDERSGYARNYGMTDTQLHRFINRYNLWDRNHFYADPAKMTGEVACFTSQTTLGRDPHRDENQNGTDDECESVGRGSRCDTFKQRCTLPYRDRKSVTLPWYFASGSSQDYFEPTRQATHEWDVALRSAIMTARYAECNRTRSPDCATSYPVTHGQQDDNQDAIDLSREVEDCRTGRAYAGKDCLALADELGGTRKYSAGVIALAKMEPALVLCHSPVESGDPAACGPDNVRLPAGTTAEQCDGAREKNDLKLVETCGKARNVRRGDLRYHQVNAIRAPQTPSPWGIMVDSHDPISGETVASSINVWSHVSDMWAQSVVDMARYIKGELTTEDITEGTYVRDWATASEAASQNGSLPKLTKEQLNELIANFAGIDAAALEKLKQNQAGSPMMRDAQKLARDASNIRADLLAPSSTQPTYEARRKRAQGTRTEAELTTKMMQSFAGNADKVGTEAMLSMASPLRGSHPGLLSEMQKQQEYALAERGACIMNEAPAPLGMANLATVLEQKFGKFNKGDSREAQLARAARMQRFLALRSHYAVITHEMGHSIGLRHNFVSSSDAWNYRPQYWQLRTDNGTNKTSCVNLTVDGSCVGPRYLDPITENERVNLLPMFMQSSTMDYAGEATQDMLGLGAYDFAATRMFYGDVAGVFQDPSFKNGTPRGLGALEKLDSFGGILGFRPTIGAPTGAEPTKTDSIHYSALQANYDLIGQCQDIDPMSYKPAAWNSELMGEWSPLLDGLMVQVKGKYSRCRQQPLDYVNWDTLRVAQPDESSNTRAGASIDFQGRVRFPYGFATDRWADIGNLSVYRHDNGADPYELFDFLITQQEVNHIFDNYRRHRATFTVRGAAFRTLTRYNEKLRDAAKGLGLMANIYKDFAVEQGYDFKGLWPLIASTNFGDNILASGIGFDHFTTQFARPEAGPHVVGASYGSKVLRSTTDGLSNQPAAPAVIIPNGATGYFGNVTPGGRPLENRLASDVGEYNAEYTQNAGSYYDKAFVAMLMTESVDNFISDQRRDFLDARYRAVSLADLFPEGYRRWLGNNLTGDDALKGARLSSDANGKPLVEEQQRFPSAGIGWTSWWKTDAQSCFRGASNILCSAAAPTNTVPVDPQVGWEQQKFLIAWTLMYLPENQQQTWLNQMNVWELGADSDPGFGNRIELHLPTGKVYVAKTSGKETVFGKVVQKGISARMLEWGNQLLALAYETTPGTDLDGDGNPDWYEVKLTNGQPRVKYDPNIKWVTDTGGLSAGHPGCNTADNSQCTCSANQACLDLERYQEVPFFMRQAMRDFGLADPSMKGIY